MTARFDYFVVFAGMRTGSNYLERNLNSVPDLKCFGELFNPYFIAHEGQEDFLGLTLSAREADPTALIDRVRAETTGLAGFRLFHDHDPRVRAAALADPRVGKIVLTRNPLDSFVSYTRALASNQWVLTDAKGQVPVPPVAIDAQAFEMFLAEQTSFLTEIRQGLARAGQTALALRYEDLEDIEVINGAIAYLGSPHRLTRPERSLKRQNPEPLSTKVEDMADVRAAVARVDPFGLDHAPPAPPDRGPAVRSFVACPRTPLLYLPMEGPEPDPVLDWMAALDGVGVSDLVRDMRQKDLRAWRAEHPGARCFTVLHHPVARAFHAFRYRIWPTDRQAYAELRLGLQRLYKVTLPETDDAGDDAFAKGFAGFLRFLRPNLAAQTSLRIDAGWVAQITALQGMAQVALPDRILRAGPELAPGLAAVAADLDVKAPRLSVEYDTSLLSRVYTPDMEKAARAAYGRDYAAFGFGAWVAPKKS